MKTAAKTMSGIMLVLLAVSGFLQSSAQEKSAIPTGSEFRYYIANEMITGTQLEFDLMLVNMNPSETFELGTVQAGILINPGIYNGGNITASIVSGSSQLNASQSPSSISFAQRKNCVKLASKAPPGIGGGSIISSDPNHPTRICRIRLTNSSPWLKGNANLRFSFNSKPYPTKISKYVHETGLNTPLLVNAYTCFTSKENVKKTGEMQSGMISEESIQIFPNPNDGNFTVGLNVPAPVVYDLQVRNELGTMLYEDENFSVEGKTNRQIRLDNLPDGNYTMILSRDGEIITKKFIIKH